MPNQFTNQDSVLDAAIAERQAALEAYRQRLIAADSDPTNYAPDYSDRDGEDLDLDGFVWDTIMQQFTQDTGATQQINAQVASYQPVASDAGKLVTMTVAGANDFTVPQDSAATIAVGASINILQLGAGQTTVVAGTGATLRVSGLTAKARAQYSYMSVQKIAANTWVLVGDLAAE